METDTQACFSCSAPVTRLLLCFDNFLQIYTNFVVALLTRKKVEKKNEPNLLLSPLEAKLQVNGI